MLKSRILLHCGAAVAATFAVSWLQIRPFGILFLILFVLWIYKTRCAASVEIITPPELHAQLLRVVDRFKNLRKDKPAVFCAICSGILGTLALIGHLMSGSNVVLIGLIVAALVSTKYNFKIVKVPKKQNFSAWTEIPDHDNDEFLPEVNESNLFVLQRASDQAVVTSTAGDDDEKSEEVPAELLIPDSIPEIDENSDTSTEDDLLLAPPRPSSDNNSSQQPIEFKRGYFKKDSSISTSSSSDDDEGLSKGLNFQDYSLVDSRTHQQQQQQQHEQLNIQQQAVATILGGNITPLSLVSGFVSWSRGSEPKSKISSSTKRSISKINDHESSDESDFEIVDSEDLNKP